MKYHWCFHILVVPCIVITDYIFWQHNVFIISLLKGYFGGEIDKICLINLQSAIISVIGYYSVLACLVPFFLCDVQNHLYFKNSFERVPIKIKPLHTCQCTQFSPFKHLNVFLFFCQKQNNERWEIPSKFSKSWLEKREREVCLYLWM